MKRPLASFVLFWELSPKPRAAAMVGAVTRRGGGTSILNQAVRQSLLKSSHPGVGHPRELQVQ